MGLYGYSIGISKSKMEHEEESLQEYQMEANMEDEMQANPTALQPKPSTLNPTRVM